VLASWKQERLIASLYPLAVWSLLNFHLATPKRGLPCEASYGSSTPIDPSDIADRCSGAYKPPIFSPRFVIDAMTSAQLVRRTSRAQSASDQRHVGCVHGSRYSSGWTQDGLTSQLQGASYRPIDAGWLMQLSSKNLMPSARILVFPVPESHHRHIVHITPTSHIYDDKTLSAILR
jgi:hypothetical protein